MNVFDLTDDQVDELVAEAACLPMNGEPWTAEAVQALVTARPRSPWCVTLHSGVKAARTFVHEIWPDHIVCGSSDTIHATFRLDTIRSIRPTGMAPAPTDAGAAYLAGCRDGAAAMLAELRKLEHEQLDTMAADHEAGR